MIEPYIIENVLSSLFDFLNKKIISTPNDLAKFDFVIQENDKKKIAIEIKSQAIRIATIKNIAKTLGDNPDIKEFYLITPEEPSDKAKEIFKSYLHKVKTKTFWVGINNFLQQQDLNIELTGDLRQTLQNLQVAAVTSRLDAYNNAIVGNNLGARNNKEQLKINLQKVKENRTGDQGRSRLYGLERQFPYSAILELEKNPEELSSKLNFGKKYEDAIIVLTDIKNFSSIVSVSDPEELNELMSKYYSNARKLVFKYDGILDKFIGDAVLAIFNYPSKDKTSFVNAIKFSTELIKLGENILKDYQRNLDQEIETGTRIGVASGPIYPLNIGSNEFEVTFIGDKINFAARLEKHCDVNGILISNRFYNKLEENSYEFANNFVKIETKLQPTDAKGQIGITTAYQIQKEEVERLLN